MATDLRINAINSIDFTPEKVTKVVDKTSDSFSKVLQAAMDVINETNQYQLDATQSQIDLATGKTDDILAVMLAQDRAFSSLNFTVQVTNKIIESYREIMRMQM